MVKALSPTWMFPSNILKIVNNGTSGGHGLKIRSGGTGTGSHLLKKHGFTSNEIIKDKIKKTIIERIRLNEDWI